MHQLAQSHRSGILNGQLTQRDIRLVLLLANSLDCEGLNKVLTQHPSIQVVAATADAGFGIARCENLRPQILIVDPKVAGDVLVRACDLVRAMTIEYLLVLDDRLHEGRVASLLKLPGVSYLTRQSSLDSLIASILHIARTKDRVFDPEIQQRLRRTRGGLRLDRPEGRPSVSVLTNRELEVMKLLADGYSVRRCAETLDLAESTIDNHKSRLMKKLDVHKTVELTHLAIREGLIVV